MRSSKRRTATRRNNGREENSVNVQVSIIPNDIIHQILCRLPVESIRSCIKVCKAWYALIHDPTFIRHHMERMKGEPCQYLIENCCGTCCQSLQQLDIQQEHLKEISFRRMRPPLESKYMLRSFFMVSSCDGLLCLASKIMIDPVIICNPIIKDCLLLPSTLATEFVLSCKNYHIGFNFDASSGKYKVVREFTFINSGSNFQLFTIGDDAWKDIIGAPNVVIEQGFEASIFWNGAFHWKISEVDNRNGNHGAILALDVTDEKFHTISFPKNERDCPHNYRLVNIGGGLNIIEHNAHFMKIWTMHGNKVDGFSIRLDHMIHLCVPPRSLLQHDLICQIEEQVYKMQFFRWENGIRKCNLFKFSPNIGQHPDLDIPHLPCLFRMVRYTPSLVSPLVPSHAST